jgi:hypothetical protein
MQNIDEIKMPKLAGHQADIDSIISDKPLLNKSLRRMENIEKLFSEIFKYEKAETSSFSSIIDICELLSEKFSTEKVVSLEERILITYFQLLPDFIEAKRLDQNLFVLGELLANQLMPEILRAEKTEEIEEVASLLLTWSSPVDVIQSILIASNALGKNLDTEFSELSKTALLRVIYSRTGIELSHEIDSDSKLNILLQVINAISFHDRLDLLLIISDKIKQTLESKSNDNWQKLSRILSNFLEASIPEHTHNESQLLSDHNKEVTSSLIDEDTFDGDIYFSNTSKRISMELLGDTENFFKSQFLTSDDLILKLCELQDKYFGEITILAAMTSALKDSEKLSYELILEKLINEFKVVLSDDSGTLKSELAYCLLGLRKADDEKYNIRLANLINTISSHFSLQGLFVSPNEILVAFNSSNKLRVAIQGFNNTDEIREDLKLEMDRISEYGNLLDMSLCSSWLKYKDREFQLEVLKSINL